MKERRQKPFSPVHQGHRMISFQPIEYDRAKRYQDKGRYQHHLGMKPAAGKAQPVLNQIVPDNKAQPAHNDQCHDRQVDKRVAPVGNKRGIRLKSPHQVKPRVAKGGYRMEYRVIRACHCPHLRSKADIQQDGACQLEYPDAQQNAPYQPYDPADMECTDCFSQNSPLRKPDPPFCHH